jgi:putative membrane protein
VKRSGRVWFPAALFAIVIVLLLVFILENSHQVDISFLGAHDHLPLAVGLIVVVVLRAVVLAWRRWVSRQSELSSGGWRERGPGRGVQRDAAAGDLSGQVRGVAVLTSQASASR